MNNIHKLLAIATLLIIGTGAWAQKPTIGLNVFGGGRMADVQNTSAAVTATINIYASTINGGVFGGNDITGKVNSATGDANASAKITIHDKCATGASVNEVYGGGNGYYKYKVDDTTIEIGNITDANKTTTVPAGTVVTVLDADGNTVTTFTTAAATTYGGLLPTLGSTNVIIGDGTGTTADAADRNLIRLNEVYGGAKNAYVTGTSGVTVYSGTIAKVFAGNNVGGTAASSSLTINGTKMASTNPSAAADFKTMSWDLVGDITTTDGDGNYSGYGIGEAYGGGNAVDVLGTATVTANGGYVRTLFGGNNLADMQGVPSISFGTSSNIYIQNVYGGGNQGDMKGAKGMLTDCSKFLNSALFTNASYPVSKVPIFVGTDVQVNSNTLYVNNVYGGCRSANVDNSTLVHVNVTGDGGYVGTVYGGSDIAGSVGYNPGKYESETTVTFTKYDHSGTEDIAFQGDMTNTSADVILTKGTVENIFGGGNGAEYASYTGSKDEPWVVSTTVGLFDGTVTGNIYGGGNMAAVGHVLTENKTYYTTSFTSGQTLRMNSYILMGNEDAATTGLTVNGKVYGGGRMADVLGTMDIYVKDGVTINELFAGNDIAGRVEGDNRGTMLGGYSSVGTTLRSEIVTDDTKYAERTVSFNGSDLTSANAQVYVRIEDGANITTLFGGGNGDYTYSDPASGVVTITDNGVTLGTVKASSAAEAKPKQVATWLDVRGKVGTAYGGGNAADITNTHVFLYGPAVVGTADVKGAVYGGCKSANVTHATNVYMASDGTNNPTVNGSLFGGCDISGNVGDTTSVCRKDDAIDAAVHLAAEPTDATEPGYAYVKILAGTVTGRVFGGGNGLQDAAGMAYYTGTPAVSGTAPADVFTYPDGAYAGKQLPVCQNTYVLIKNAVIGTTADSYADVHTVFGGGQGAGTKVMHNVFTLLGDGTSGSTVQTTVKGIEYGGSYAGFVNSTCSDITQTTILGYGSNTQVLGDIYGGSYGNYVRGEIQLNINNIQIGVDDTSVGIYAGNNNAGQPECNASINYVGSGCNVTLYGGGNKAPFYGTTRITFTKGSVGYIYGGGNQAPVYGNTIVEVLGGHVCYDVFGGGNQGGVFKNTEDADNTYGGNTLVIVRDDCLKLKDGSTTEFETDAITGNYSANYGSDLYSEKYFNSNDPSADDKDYHILTPNSAGKKTTVEIEGNVYGGGNAADVEGKATVIIGNKAQ